MAYLLQNKNLKIYIDDPLEGYDFSRFDWTGKITKVVYKNIPVSVPERTDDVDENKFGKAFYNEFGIDSALGFDEAAIGDWFHKIGVGLLRKDSEQYTFNKPYEIQPAAFNVKTTSAQITISCISDHANGYGYELTKVITLLESGFIIDYTLQNNGEKVITTDEYVHNFVAVNNERMGVHYSLNFPFQLDASLFNDAVNPEGKVVKTTHGFSFNGSPKDQFFYSNLTGNKDEKAQWQLTNTNKNITISETGSFKTVKINLWGWHHVISPELFFNIKVKPGDSLHWSRRYHITQTI